MNQIKKIIFFGTPEFSVPSLQALVKNEFNVISVVTQPDKPTGRGQKYVASPIKQCAEVMGIPVQQPRSVRKEPFLKWIREQEADIHVVVAYGKIFPLELLNIPNLTLNVHASLLPRWRGASPISKAIEAGDKKTGVSIMKLVEEMDAGDYCIQEELPIGPNINKAELEEQLSHLGAQALIKALKKYEKNELNFTSQNLEDVTFSPPVQKEEGNSDWNQTSQTIHDKCRAFNPWPSLQTHDGHQSIKILKTAINQTPPSQITEAKSPGTLEMTKKQLWVHTKDGLIEILEVQAQGKKAMPTQAFVAGYRSKNIEKWM